MANEVSKRERILVYDPDPPIGRMLGGFLHRAGYAVQTVVDRAAFAEVLAREGCDLSLVLEDLSTKENWVPPTREGAGWFSEPERFYFGNAELLSLTAPQAARLYTVTTRGLPERLHVPHLVKPFTFTDLIAAVEKQLQHAALIYSAERDTPELNETIVRVEEVSDRLLVYLAQHPNALRELGWRKFEELVAHMLEQSGFEAELQAGTKDGGVDIVAAKHAHAGDVILLVQCKHVTQNVGVKVIRELYGVTNQRNASGGMIVTTATFTKSAREFQALVGARLALRDYEKLTAWLRELARGAR